ncbi:MAG: hypothetical protein AB1348_07545 [Nitrospirota bacterium]
MKPFHTIATPHKDILEGRLTVDITAKNGRLSDADYEDRIKEGLRQANIEIEREEKS